MPLLPASAGNNDKQWINIRPQGLNKAFVRLETLYHALDLDNNFGII